MIMTKKFIISLSALFIFFSFFYFFEKGKMEEKPSSFEEITDRKEGVEKEKIETVVEKEGKEERNKEKDIIEKKKEEQEKEKIIDKILEEEEEEKSKREKDEGDSIKLIKPPFIN